MINKNSLKSRQKQILKQKYKHQNEATVNKIYINVKTQQSNHLLLILSSNNYKDQFKEFVRNNKFTKQEAIKLKELILNKIRQSIFQQELIQQQNQSQSQDNIQTQRSPSFSPVHQNLVDQISSINSQVDNKLYQSSNSVIPPKTNKQKIQKLSNNIFSSSQHNEQKKKYFLIENYKTSQAPKTKQTIKLEQNFIKVNNSALDKSKSKQKKQTSKSVKVKQKQQRQRQINHKIFFRLNESPTQSFLKKFKKQQNPKQQKDYEQILRFNLKMKKNRKVQNLQQSLTYLSSTQSSFHRSKKYTSEYIKSNQIQNYIKKDIALSKPKMNSRVYSPIRNVSCNCHCEKYSYQKQQAEKSLQKKSKQKEIKRDLLTRDNSPRSFHKRSGECYSCHQQRILAIRRKQQFQNNVMNRRKHNKLPNNQINFMSDVLEQSYQELFVKTP